MGEQGAKTLRGGKMEDVIFAGTSGRAPLGRAEVSLTIDNSDGALPIDYTEVTISRIMFRSGGSEYSINGSACRLLDVQELLSDSGIGREMHVIVGQGQLDSILHATPEERRGFVEEAAGVLKHRKRKEKALRKLDGLSDKLTRLQDLSVELRRQLKPLGRQAEVARRAAVIQADVRDARLRLLADDYVTATTALQRDVADEEALLHKRAEREAELLALRSSEAQLQAQGEQAEPLLATAEDLWHRLTRVTERLRGIAAVAAERRSVLDAATPVPSGRDPEHLRAEADGLLRQHAELLAQAQEHRDRVAAAVASRQALEDELAAARRTAEHQRRSLEAARTALGKASGRLSAATAAVGAREAELQRALVTAEQAQRAMAEVHAEDGRSPADDPQAVDLSALQGAWDRAKAQRSAAASAVTASRAALQRAHKEASATTAKADTLARALAGMDANSGTAALAAEADGVLGNVADLVAVPESLRPAVIASLGALSEGLVVSDLQVAAAGLRMLRDRGVDRAELVIAGGRPHPQQPPPVGRLLTDGIDANDESGAAVVALLTGFVLVADLDEAVDLLSHGGDWVAVTPQGDVLGRRWARGGVRDGSTRWDMHDQVEQARRQADRAAAAVEAVQGELDAALAAEQQHAAEVENARTAWQDARTRQAAQQERATQWQRRVSAAEQAARNAAQRVASLQDTLAADRAAVALAEAEVASAQERMAQSPEPSVDTQADAIERLGELRQSETEARLSLRTVEERASSLSQRAAGLKRAADEEERARQRAATAQRARLRRAAIAEQVGGLALRCAQQAEADLARVSEQRAQLRQQAAARQARLAELRNSTRDLELEVARLTDSVHRDEVARAEQRLRIEQIADRALSDHGIEAGVLVAEYGPQVLILPSAAAPGDEEDGVRGDAEPYPYDRLAQERRLRAAERSLSLLGTVNPLALEEFAALEERHTYLNEQIEDIKRTKTDLLGIVKDVDARVEEVFGAAFADTAVQFERVFARLFPGGEGRLVLTDPGDLLNTGVDVEARPPGKKIKRLSLLSGGERSLTAVAFLVALFKARPSPFYVLDEVEAALDDTNLGRLIEVIEELRASSQLIVITHQKRTMEAADALYGVSMRRDGVTHVISQRLAEHQPRQPAGAEAATIDLSDGAAAGR
jgi:chromosome segregation protein